MLATGRWIHTVMPRIDAKELIERDIDALANELYSIPHDSVLEWLKLVSAAIERETDIVDVRDLDRMTSEHPDAFGDAAFFAFTLLLLARNCNRIGRRRALAARRPRQPLARRVGRGTQHAHARPGPHRWRGILPDALTSELPTPTVLVRQCPPANSTSPLAIPRSSPSSRCFAPSGRSRPMRAEAPVRSGFTRQPDSAPRRDGGPRPSHYPAPFGRVLAGWR